MTDQQHVNPRTSFTLALRSAMGMPKEGSTADGVRYLAGGPLSIAMQIELARSAADNRFDLICSSWSPAGGDEPTGLIVAYRFMSDVEFFSCVPVAGGKEDPIVLYSPKADRTFYLDERGLLASRQGKPMDNVDAGHRRAVKRLRRIRTALGDAPHVEWFAATPGERWPEEPQANSVVVQLDA